MTGFYHVVQFGGDPHFYTRLSDRRQVIAPDGGEPQTRAVQHGDEQLIFAALEVGSIIVWRDDMTDKQSRMRVTAMRDKEFCEVVRVS